MNTAIKAAAFAAAALGMLAVSACEEMAAVTEGILIACENDPAGCDEVFFTGKGPPPALDRPHR